MAWQLIHTSAPQLLEAGRSGFGTVARHRSIPDALVTGIESISCFNPGGRIVYAHRLMNAGGTRYHVLSRIRDAGADSAGGPNHIAHHLIITAKEAAAATVSPVDVLLSFAWRDHWNDAPAHLDATSELSLELIPRVVRLPAKWWERATGNPRYAALLLEPGTERGCGLVYTIEPQRDPRQQAALLLFGESLLLAQGRNWAFPFTTHFLPGDPTSFQWIGIPPDSPVRAQIEQSGRVVYVLEPGLTVKKNGITPVIPRGPAADSAQTGRLPAAAAPAPKSPLPPGSNPPPPPPKFRWGLLAGAAAAIALVTIAGVLIARKKSRDDLATTVTTELDSVPGHKEGDAATLLAQIGRGRTQEDVATIARDARDLSQNWVKVLETAEPGADTGVERDVRQLMSYNVSHPDSIPAFTRLAEDWLGLRDKVIHTRITGEQSYYEYASLCDAINSWVGPAELNPARDSLLQKNAAVRARFLIDCLSTGETRPKQPLFSFLDKLDALHEDLKNTRITNSALADDLDTLNSILTLWDAVEKSEKDHKPADGLKNDHFHESELSPAWLSTAVDALLNPTPSPTPQR
ncbi:MAG TPA: hypothetical protein VG733_15755 [Chthoniobacteraceae bacterium]|nr:hypothetical protein [Chthoniobacteraceae bacterium]